MELDSKSAFGGCGLVVVLVVLVVVGLVVVPGLLSGLRDSKTDRLMAEASLLRAREQLEYSRSVAFQERFMVWTGWLDHNGDGALLVLAFAGGALALGGGFWLGRGR